MKDRLLPAFENIAVTAVEIAAEGIRADVRSTAPGAYCPGCGGYSGRVHGSYLRFPADTPTAGRPVVLRMRVRRFTCSNTTCPRRTFAEQVNGLTRRHGQRTERLRSTVTAVGLALAGRAGARLARVLGIAISRSTLLRLVCALADPLLATPRAVGIDEYATRKGRAYGTVSIDLETRRPVDLLPDRETSTVAAWLRRRPGIEVVCRDRAPFFAEAAAVGAPNAVQVAERWHLWHNLSEAAERAVAAHRRCLQVLVGRPSEPENGPDTAEPAPDSPWPTGHRFADRIRDRHAAVRALLQAGHSKRSVQRQLGMGSTTVQRLAGAAQPEDLFVGQWQNRPSVLDPFKPYLDDRWDEGCANAWKLWEEIVPLGYPGSYQRVRAYLRRKRTSPGPVTARPPAPRIVAGWILRHPES